MWFSFTLLLALSTLGVGVPLVSEKRQSCPTYIVVEAPGLGDGEGTWTSPTTYQLLDALAGGERYLLKTQPPPDDGPDTDPVEIITDASAGAAEIVETVATNFAQCPDVKFVLFGYSYGTIEQVIAMNNPALLRPPIAAVILYGNCFWHQDRIEDQGTAVNGTSVCGSVEGLETPLILEDVTADYCLVNDYLCTGTPYDSPLNSHWSYRDSQWQDDAVNFAVGRITSGDDFPIVT